MNTYELKVTFVQGRELASWDFNNQGTTECCEVHEGDVVNVSFEGPGTVAHAVMLCGQMEPDKKSSPFKLGNNIDLIESSSLKVADQQGLWGFSIAFSARNPDDSTSFYYVPDPEILVKSRPTEG